MSNLIERLKGLQEWYSRNTGEGILHAAHLNALSEAITALSPVMPDDVAELAAWLDEYTADDPMHSAVNSHYKLRRILKMLERQGRENALLLKTNADHAERIDTYTDRIEELKAALKKIKNHTPSIYDTDPCDETVDLRLIAEAALENK